MPEDGEIIGDQEVGSTLPAKLAVRLAFVLSAAYLLAGLALYGLAASQLVWPDIADGVSELTYGRALPAGANTLLFGWLTVALIGIAFHAVPRLSGSPLAFPWIALGVMLLASGGAGAGVAFVLLGDTAGGRWLEFPMLVDGALVVGYLAAAALLTLTARRGKRGLPVAGWYLIAAPWWLFLAYAAGAIPGLDGLAAEIQSGFTATTVIGLGGVAGAVGAGYFAVSQRLPEAMFNERLGRIGFWSLAFTWAWSSGRLFQYGPTSDWVETVPVLFGAGLVVAALSVGADFAGALRGRWSEVRSTPSVQLAVAGVALLAAAPPIAFVASLRSVSAVTRFTAWDTGFDEAVLLGAATLLVLAGVTSIASGKHRWGKWWGRAVLWPVLMGAVVAVGTRLASGLQQGYAWLAGVESGAYENIGADFERSAAGLEGLDLVHAAAIGLVAIGAAFFTLRLLWFAALRWQMAGVTLGDHEQRPVGIVRGAVAVFAIAALGTFAFPAIDSVSDPSLLADSSRLLADGSSRAAGRDVYIAEGCWYCHTQQVRAVVTDVGLGTVSVQGDYAHDPVGLAGWRRIGPDLTHAGDRIDDPALFARHIENPRSIYEWSVMPAYGHLTDAEVAALFDYVSGL